MNNKNLKQTFRKSLAAIAITSILATAPVYASNTSGQIVGETIISNGAIIGQVEVTIINSATGLTRQVTSNEDGKFRFPLLPSGTYNIYATKDGYSIAEQEGVNVGVGDKTNLEMIMNIEGIETIEIRGSSVALLDTTSTTSSLEINAEEIARLPVSRDISSVAALAPGVNKGDNAFGNLVSFGGSSVAENTYYVNGLNVTNARNAVGFSRIPFDMYDDVSILTGGYSAEFGRSTGGVISATTKKGDKEFKGGLNVVYRPDSLRENAPNVYRTAEGVDKFVNQYLQYNEGVIQDRTDVNLWASGELIEDKVFFYGMYNPIFQTRENTGNWTYSTNETDDAFYGGKLDWYIDDDQTLELTFFSDERTEEVTIEAYDPINNVKGQYINNNIFHAEYGRVVQPKFGSSTGVYDVEKGGLSFAAKYGYIINDDLNVSVMYGQTNSKQNTKPVTNADLSVITDRSTGRRLQGPITTGVQIQDDTREQLRIDFDYYLGDHELRFGLDYEIITVDDLSDPSGDGSYSYSFDTGVLFDYLETGEGLEVADSDLVRQTIFENSGVFETESMALYIQDKWEVADNVTLNLGLRYDQFNNKNAEGDSYVKMTDQIAPRLGIAWDPTGNGDMKVTASYGRFFLPIATNTNVRLAGRERFQIIDYTFTGIDPTTLVPEGLELDRVTTFNDGSVKDTKQLLDSSIEAMQQDEFQVAFSQSFLDDFTWGAKVTYRDLITGIEDVTVDHALAKAAEAQGIECTTCYGNYYVVTNPGSDVTMWADPDGDGPGEFQKWKLPSEDLGYPDMERKYIAWDFTIERPWQDDWSLRASYTWSHSWGNYEGSVNSDIGQFDSGITQSFDFPGLVDNSAGNLPNDKRHQLKLSGAYAITDELTVGFNSSLMSGRPKNCMGFHPSNTVPPGYGPTAFYCLEVDPESDDMENPDYISVPSPRGSHGTTKNTFVLDLNLKYNTTIAGVETHASIDVFNILNKSTPSRYNPTGQAFDPNTLQPIQNPDFGLPVSYQRPRYVQFTLGLKY
ncbi:TonB-dependent receptor [Thalassotalea psychrophila]|uniref:TonB-dependent receptor n=1 Tax=Thalassotalea psychrophila TaxID=3065647 RepID=A0ABY9TZB5_9GAMM|nr:TonB-dependent receptor [Colwelliaceae bacterium SQ149]